MHIIKNKTGPILSNVQESRSVLMLLLINI
jgi:hypothetical protein